MYWLLVATMHTHMLNVLNIAHYELFIQCQINTLWGCGMPVTTATVEK